MTAETQAPLLTLDSRVRDVWQHPLGRDVINKILMQLGRPTKLVDNPVIGSLRLRTLQRIIQRWAGEGFVEALLSLLNQHRELPAASPEPWPKAWWQEAVFYQVYPRSFMDSNGDGVGDLQGIISRLDYLHELGVDALWLSPIYDSPNDDNGYDIRNYREISAEFGTMADFDQLIAELDRRGMKLVMDLVVNHTSDEHEWFQSALADPDSPTSDYYFFRPGTADTPPNNWTSFFSGPAWRWFPEREEWALHLFSSKQMDLNWDHAPLRQEIVDMVRWWLAKGVDGFRLDVINYISKPPELPEGNATVGELMQFTGVEHYFVGPRLHEYLRQLQAEAFEPFDAVSIGETPGIGAEVGKMMTGPDRGELNMIFNFDHLETPGHTRYDDYRYDLEFLRDFWTSWQQNYGAHCWPSLFTENHDNPRMVSKIDPDPAHREALAKLIAVVQLTLRGSPFIYQGQELGLVNHHFSSIEQFRDVESLNRFAALRLAGATEAAALADVLAGSRDHSRVPMPWSGETHGGFSSAEPWLQGDSVPWHAEAQQQDPRSVLNDYRALIALRRSTPALRLGEVTFAKKKKGLWEYIRSLDGDRVLVIINLKDQPKRWQPPAGAELLYASDSGAQPALAPYEARVYRVSSSQ